MDCKKEIKYLFGDDADDIVVNLELEIKDTNPGRKFNKRDKRWRDQFLFLLFGVLMFHLHSDILQNGL
jgi:hypothetical protein